jgi:flagellar assembly factor FliW
MTAAPMLRDDRCVVQTRRFGPILVAPDAILTLPEGMPGFEELQRFVLLPVRDDLAWFQSMDLPALAFLLVRVDRVDPAAAEGRPDAWAIVTLGDAPGSATANLLAPLFLDRAAGTAVQRISATDRWHTAHPVDLEGPSGSGTADR